MAEQMPIAVVIPAYNEAQLIGRTLGSVPDFVHRIYVVDDASQDDTAQLAAKASDGRVRVIRHGHNRGVGAAIATGYGAAFSDGARVCAVMAGDAQMDPDDLRSLLEPVLGGQADYAKGDRLSHPAVRARMPPLRLLGNSVLSALTRLATGLSLNDSQCGYTALGRDAYERIDLTRLWPRYGYPNDLLGWLALSGARVQDVVVTPIYGEEQSGIGLRHALLVIPFVLLRTGTRRLAAALLEPRRLRSAIPGRFR